MSDRGNGGITRSLILVKQRRLRYTVYKYDPRFKHRGSFKSKRFL